jgi:hypothetical protein
MSELADNAPRTMGEARAVSIAGRCADCRYFVSAPAQLEARLPGLQTLGSAYGAVRGDDGLCERHERYLRSSRGCAQFQRGRCRD